MTTEEKEDSGSFDLIDILRRLREIFKLLLAKWKLICICGFSCAFLGLFASFISKASYEASLIFTIDGSSKSGALSGLLSMATQMGGGGAMGGMGGADAFSEENLVEILKTRSLIEKALLTSVYINGKNDLLANHFIRIHEYHENWKDDSRLKNFRFKNTDRSKFTFVEDSLLGVFNSMIIDQISVDKLGKLTSLISVRFTSGDELFTKYFTEKLVSGVSDYYIELKTRKIRSSLYMIQSRSDSIQRALLSAEYSLAKWKDSRKMIVKMEGNVMEATLIRNVQILDLMYAEVIKQLELTKFTLLNQTPLIQVIDKPILPLNKKKLGKVRGLVLGGLLGGFFSCLYVIARKFISDFLQKLKVASL